MNIIAAVSSLPEKQGIFHSLTPERVKKSISLAIAAILAVGMLFSYSLGAPWFIVFLFFGLSLAPLLSFGISSGKNLSK